MDTWVVVCVKHFGANAGMVGKARKRYMNRKQLLPNVSDPCFVAKVIKCIHLNSALFSRAVSLLKSST